VIGPGTYYPMGNAEPMSEGEYQEQYGLVESAGEDIAVPDGFWRTREGVILAMTDMTDDHIENALRRMERSRLHRDGPRHKYHQLLVEKRRRAAGL